MDHEPRIETERLKRIKLPILSQDEKWLEIMGPHLHEDMRILMARQTALIQEERQAGNQLIELKRQKKEALAQLLALSDQLQRMTPEAEHQACRLKALLDRINEEMDHLQYKLDTAPSEIRSLNLALMQETIAQGYGLLLEDHRQMAVLNLKIQKLRQELLSMNEEKFALEDKAADMGQYLHALLGKELSDELDVHYGLNDEEYVL